MPAPTSHAISGASSCMPVSDNFRHAYEQVLVLWLRWNDAHERITTELFERRADQLGVEELLSQVDELREQAVKASRTLLAN